MRFHADMSLNEWNVMFDEIYYRNQNKNYHLYDVQMHLWEILSYFSRSFNVQKVEIPEIENYLAKSIAWYFALIKKLNVKDLEEIIWKKYPYCCPYCQNKHCNYAPIRKKIDLKKLESIKRKNKSKKPESFLEWQCMFDGIYGNRNIKLEPRELMGKILEEIGETIEAIRLLQKNSSNINWKNEIADIFAWIIGATNYANNKFQVNINIGKETFKKYPKKCSNCKKKPCKCEFNYIYERYSESGPFKKADDGKPQVFIVHGQKPRVLSAVTKFVKNDLKMKPIVLENLPQLGRTIIEKFQQASNVYAAIIILTPDDEIKNNSSKKLKVARQNVMMEMGYFYAQLGRANVILLHHKDVVIPSNIFGMGYVGFKNFTNKTKQEIKKEFKGIKKK